MKQETDDEYHERSCVSFFLKKSLYQLLCRQLRDEEKAYSVEDVCIAAGLLVAMPARPVSQEGHYTTDALDSSNCNANRLT